jgi:FkbM family methyltransferase
VNILQNGVAVVDGDTHHGVWCAKQGLVHDKWFAGEITKHLKPGDVAIDCGANIGTLTKAMLDAGAIVMAVDANKKALECLAKNCESELLFILHAAISDLPGNVRLVENQNAGKSHCESDGDIQTVALDSLPIDGDVKLIKMDIEGFEAKAIRGARNLIRRCKPVMIVEVNSEALKRSGDSEDELLAIIEEVGYTWEIMQPDCKRGDDQYDVVCLPV